MSSTPNQARPGPSAAPPRQTSSLAIASLVCSCALFCPVAAPLAGIVLGSAALRRIRASRGGLGGRRLALAGTFLGSVVLIVQIGLAAAGLAHHQRHLDESMIKAVHGFVEAASDNDPLRARKFWHSTRTSPPSSDDMTAFGEIVQERYGRLTDFRAVSQIQTGGLFEQGMEVAAYFRFERGERTGWARFAIAPKPGTLYLEAWLEKLVIEDPEQANIVIPAEPTAARTP